MFIIVHGIDKVNCQNKPQYLEEVSTRGHNQKLRRQPVKKSNLRHHFFTNRIKEKWNILQEEVIN
jgi:hypothetical protein